MKIKQIGEFNGDIISTILRNRNIEDVSLLNNPTDENNLDPFKLHNLRAGAEILLAHLNVSSKIGLVVDPDADGFTSSTIIYQYMKLINPNIEIQYFLHESKAHGLTEKIVEEICEAELDLLVVPDAGSNDDEQIARLHYMGIDVLIIDHHEVDSPSPYCILINNQLEENEETNKNLVGAGMVYKFCEALDSMLNENHSSKFLDLVCIGQIGDASDISQNEVRNYVFKGLRNLTNPFISEVLNSTFSDVNNISPKDLSFSIIPLINSVVRVGTMEEKQLLFRALNSIGSEQTWDVIKKKKNKETGKFDKFEVVQNLYEYAHDSCKKVKARQAALVKKVLVELEPTIDSSGGIAIGIVPTSNEGSITGLVANKLVGKFQKPILLLHYIEPKENEKGKYVGSGRGYEKVLSSLKDWCNETELVEFAQGHANAFGISIFEENFEEFKERTKTIQSQEIVYEVDLLEVEKVTKQYILDIDENKSLFGGKVREPLFAYENLKIRKEFIRQRGSMLTFYEAGVEFVMYGAPNGLFESLTHNFDSYIPMTLVGRASINEYGGRKNPQIVLEDCERTIISEEAEEAQVTVENIVF